MLLAVCSAFGLRPGQHHDRRATLFCHVGGYPIKPEFGDDEKRVVSEVSRSLVLKSALARRQSVRGLDLGLDARWWGFPKQSPSTFGEWLCFFCGLYPWVTFCSDPRISPQFTPIMCRLLRIMLEKESLRQWRNRGKGLGFFEERHNLNLKQC